VEKDFHLEIMHVKQKRERAEATTGGFERKKPE
jgi:hypothetical protein